MEFKAAKAKKALENSVKKIITNKGETPDRKISHINIILNKPVQFREKSTWFEDVQFVHQALPEIDFDEIDLSTRFLGFNFKAPILISAMTGGHPATTKINAALAEAAKHSEVGLELGSQRAAIEDPSLIESFAIARRKAPNIFLIGNIGAGQLSKGWGIQEVKAAMEMINADALAIHLNPLQEAIQPEGDVNFRDVQMKIREITSILNKPIIAKETGSGISKETAILLQKSGVAAIQVGGAGGTSFAAVEKHRSAERSLYFNEQLGDRFWDWGIPTAASTLEVVNTTNLPIISSGGIRNGIQVAKAIALGADIAGLAYPLLKPASSLDHENVQAKLDLMFTELKIAMFLVGAKNLKELRRIPLVVKGNLLNWIKQRHIRLKFPR